MKYNLKKYLICCISETNKFTLQKNFYNKIWYTHVYIHMHVYICVFCEHANMRNKERDREIQESAVLASQKMPL